MHVLIAVLARAGSRVADVFGSSRIGGKSSESLRAGLLRMSGKWMGR